MHQKNSKFKKLYVLHEYGAKSHYTGLRYFCDSLGVDVSYYEFRVLYQFAKGVFKKDITLIKRSISNLIFILKILFCSSTTERIVIGIAPYDWRIVLINFLSRGYRTYYHTSWPYWEGKFTPKRCRFSFIQDEWKKYLFKCEAIFVVTQSVKNGLLRKYTSLSENKIVVVYHSLDSEFYKCAIRERNVKKDLDRKKNLKVIYIGRYDVSKGVDIVEKMAENIRFSNVEFIFVGHGPYKIRNIANVRDVGFVNSRKKMALLLADCDVLVLPGKKTKIWQELFGMVVIEAMCCGVFPIVTNHLGPKEILENVDGTLLDPENIYGDLLIKFEKFRSMDTLRRQQCINGLFAEAEKYKVEVIATLWATGINND